MGPLCSLYKEYILYMSVNHTDWKFCYNKILKPKLRLSDKLLLNNKKELLRSPWYLYIGLGVAPGPPVCE